MTDMKLLIYVGGAVGGIMIFFFGWVIQLIRTQNKSAILSVQEHAEIKIKLETHEIKIENIEKDMSTKTDTINKIQSDMNDLKVMAKENNIIMSIVRDSQAKLEILIQSIIK